jgi:hypothetical protein
MKHEEAEAEAKAGPLSAISSAHLRDEEDADAQESEITQLLQLGAEDFAVR